MAKVIIIIIIIIRASPAAVVLSIMPPPSTLKLDEEKSKHMGLGEQNGFGPAFLYNLVRLVNGTSSKTSNTTCQRRSLMNVILPFVPYF
jgi:hypothetical protein